MLLVFYQILFLMFIGVCSVSAYWRNPPGVAGLQGGDVGKLCNPGLPGPVGEEGDPGGPGYHGPKGIKGEAGSSFARPPPGEQCRCPRGPDGERGTLYFSIKSFHDRILLGARKKFDKFVLFSALYSLELLHI